MNTDNGKKVVIDVVLRRLVEEKNMTQKQVADAVGLPPSTFHDWNYGRIPRDLVAVDRIAEYFKVSLYYMLFGEKTDQEVAIKEARKAKFELEMYKLQNSAQLSLFETKEEALARLEDFKKRIETDFPEEIGA